ncbi:MAG TPA: histidinol dehydrogenase, partial [Vicinamibacterales bacterium]|nr:histidinol dehydrogenase [Vicinamibacterales bacterium]
MRILSSNDAGAIERLAVRNRAMDPAVVRQAARIVRDVRRRGDAAVAAWTRRLDGHAVRPGHFEVSRREIARGWDETPRDVRAAIRLAIRNVRRVAVEQRPRPFSVEVQPGVRIEQRVQPLERVGCYVPGGRYPLPSTVVMTVTPAVVAGVEDITVACPWPHPAVLCAALEAGATRVLRAGGAQAIAALAYGTRSIARVDKIAGPGNAWVAAAKTLVSRDCAIDFQAGPSEILICSDDGSAAWIAADLIAQAEHDPDARAIFVTTRRTMARDVAAAVTAQMPLHGPARRALRRHGAIVVAASRDAATRLVNRIAPEHLVCDRAAD